MVNCPQTRPPRQAVVRIQNYRSTILQREWGNLSFLHVEPVRPADPFDATEDLILRMGIFRRRYPHLCPADLLKIVKAGIRAELQAFTALGVEAVR